MPHAVRCAMLRNRIYFKGLNVKVPHGKFRSHKAALVRAWILLMHYEKMVVDELAVFLFHPVEM